MSLDECKQKKKDARLTEQRQKNWLMVSHFDWKNKTEICTRTFQLREFSMILFCYPNAWNSNSQINLDCIFTELFVYFRHSCLLTGTTVTESLHNFIQSFGWYAWKSAEKNCLTPSLTQSYQSCKVQSLAIAQAKIHKCFDICIINWQREVRGRWVVKPFKSVMSNEMYQVTWAHLYWQMFSYELSIPFQCFPLTFS